MIKSLLLSMLLTAGLQISAAAPQSSPQPVRQVSGDRTAESSPTPALSAQCLLVDGSLTDAEAAQNPFVFNSFKEAMQHLQPGTSAENRMTVLIRPGVYWIDDPDDPEVRKARDGDRVPIGMHVRCQWLHLVGLGEQPDEVILASNRGQTQGAVGNFTMFFFHGNGLLLENLTLGNYCNVDLEYRLDPSKNRKRRMEAICQAQLAFADGDYLEARNCRFISRLNTCPLNGGRRTLFDHCYFESTDDALEGRAVYRHCRFTFFSSKPFYATSRAGAILYDCDFDVKTVGPQYLCKQESPVILIDCRFQTPENTTLGWCPYISPRLRCYQENVMQNGKRVTLSPESEGTTVSLEGKKLSEKLKSALKGDIRMVFGALESLPIHLELHADKDRVEEGETATTTLYSYAFGDSLLGQQPAVQFTGTNNTETSAQQLVVVSRPDGQEAATSIENAPKTLPAPEFTKQLKIKRKEDVLTASYSLNLGKRTDQSLITWYRCDDKEGRGAVPVSVSRLNRPEQTYTLQPADYGRYIMAEVLPKHQRSLTGEPQRAMLFIKPSLASGVLRSNRKTYTYETNFQNFPTEPQPLIKDGYWTVDGHKPADTNAQPWQPKPDSWMYGPGIDGAKGTGLLQKEKGARLLYTPCSAINGRQVFSGQTAEISITLVCDPCKTAAQGFASATDQYMDIYIHYNTQTLTGYGLRIIRTTKYANAVDMQLMRFSEGRGELLGEPVSTTCFLTGCTIHLWSEGNLLKAHVSTTTPQRESTLAKEVNFAAPIEPLYNGIGIQHTGSAGASATMLHYLKAEWK